MDLAQLRRDAGLAREQLLKIVQEDTPFSYRKFTSLGGKGLTARLDNLVPDDYIVIVNNKNKEDYYRLPYKSFLNLLDIYKDELEDRRNRGASKIAQIKKRAQGNRDKGKPDLFLQNERLFSILDRTRDAVKLSQSKREAETFTAEASKPVGPPPPPEPKKIPEGFSERGLILTAGSIYKPLIYDGIPYLLDEDNYVYSDEYDLLGRYDGEDVEWDSNKAWKNHKRKMVVGAGSRERVKELEGEDYFFEGLDYKVTTEGEIFDRGGTIIAKIPNYPENKENPVFVNRDKHLDNYPIIAFPQASKFLYSEPHPDWIKRRTRAHEQRKREKAEEERNRSERNRVIPPHPEDDDLTSMPVLYQGVEYRLLKPDNETDLIKYHTKIKVMYGTEFIGYWDKGDEYDSTDGRANGFSRMDILDEELIDGSIFKGFRSDQLEAEAGLTRKDRHLFSLFSSDRGIGADGFSNPRSIRVIWLSPKRPKWLFVDPVPEPESEEEPDDPFNPSRGGKTLQQREAEDFLMMRRGEMEPDSEDELAIEDFDDDDDDDDDLIISLRYEGVFYSIESDNNVLDDDFDDVGEWVNDDIKFTKQGAKVHKNLRDTSADKIVWLSDKRPK